MKEPSKPRTSPAVWPTAAQALRQLGLILLAVAIWVGLLLGYLALMEGGAEPAAEPPQPTEVAVASAPTPTSTSTAAAAVSFSKDVLPLLKTHCERCHGAGQALAGIKLTSYADVLAGSGSRPIVIPGSAATSRLVEAIVTGRMPRGGPKLPATEIEIIEAWVNAGAPDN